MARSVYILFCDDGRKSNTFTNLRTLKRLAKSKGATGEVRSVPAAWYNDPQGSIYGVDYPTFKTCSDLVCKV